MTGFALQRSAAAEKRQRNIENIPVEGWNQRITETAGFIPLEVRFQKLIESGQRVTLRAQEFDSVDMRKLYLSDEFRVEPDDELEDILLKQQKRAEFLRDILNRREKEAVNADNLKKTPEMKSQESASDSAPETE